MLQVINAECVREGEPRRYCADERHADDQIRDGLNGPLHLIDRGEEFAAWPLAIVDRPATTTAPVPVMTDIKTTTAPTPAPTYCEIDQHTKWCGHNGGVMGATGWEAPAPPNRFDCAECGQAAVKADEDGCCSSCGRDCAVVIDGKQIATSAPTPGLDLEAIERAERAMAPGPWRWGDPLVDRNPHESPMNIYAGRLDDTSRCVMLLEPSSGWSTAGADSEGIVALRNAAPALIAEVRALRARLAEVRELIDAERAAARGNDHGLRSARRLFIGEIAEAAGIPEPQIEHRIETSATPDNCQAWDDAAWSVRCAVRKLRDELAAARAVPADVEAALAGPWANGYEEGRADAMRRPGDRKKPSTRAASINYGKAAIARAIAEARQPATVGGQEADPVAAPIASGWDRFATAAYWIARGVRRLAGLDPFPREELK